MEEYVVIRRDQFTRGADPDALRMAISRLNQLPSFRELKLFPPEILCEDISPERLKSLSVEVLTGADPLFKPLIKAIDLLVFVATTMPDRLADCELVVQSYREFVKQVCESADEDRLRLLRGAASLVGRSAIWKVFHDTVEKVTKKIKHSWLVEGNDGCVSNIDFSDSKWQANLAADCLAEVLFDIHLPREQEILRLKGVWVDGKRQTDYLLEGKVKRELPLSLDEDLSCMSACIGALLSMLKPTNVLGGDGREKHKIHPKVVKRLLQADPHHILLRWLAKQDEYERRFGLSFKLKMSVVVGVFKRLCLLRELCGKNGQETGEIYSQVSSFRHEYKKKEAAAFPHQLAQLWLAALDRDGIRLIGEHNDLEGVLYRSFRDAYKRQSPLEQILSLLRISDLYLEKKEHEKAAQLTNLAVRCIDINGLEAPLRKTLIGWLERIEERFLCEELKVDVLDYHSPIQSRRDQLLAIRRGAVLEVEADISIELVLAKQTRLFKNLLAEMIEEGTRRLGPSPIKNFLALAFGSMARGEMCLYSDVEWAILVTKDCKAGRAYFTRLARFVRMLTISLGETSFEVFPGDGSLPKGFEIDTKVRPVDGLEWLICTPKQLAQLQLKQEHARDKIVTNALRSFGPLVGDTDLLGQYRKQLDRVLSRGSRREDTVRELLHDSLKDFRPNMSSRRMNSQKFGVKKEFYRPIQEIISALALLFNLPECNTLERIANLQQRGVFSKDGALNLSDAIRAALLLRFRVHKFYEREKEIVCVASADLTVARAGQRLFTASADERQLIEEIYLCLEPFTEAVKEFANSKFSKELTGQAFSGQPFLLSAVDAEKKMINAEEKGITNLDGWFVTYEQTDPTTGEITYGMEPYDSFDSSSIHQRGLQNVGGCKLSERGKQYFRSMFSGPQYEVGKEKFLAAQARKALIVDPHNRKAQEFLALHSSDLVEIGRSCRLAAMSEDPTIQLRLAVCYMKGLGVQTDVARSRRLLKSSSEQGNGLAQYYLGVCLLGDDGGKRNLSMAIAWLKKSAENGRPEAMRLLGTISITNAKLGISKEEGKRYFDMFREVLGDNWKDNPPKPDLSAMFEMLDLVKVIRGDKDVGHPRAPRIFELNKMVVSDFESLGGETDAVRLYEVTACYLKEQGVMADGKKAAVFLKRSADLGNADAMYLLGGIYLRGAYFEQDLPRAITYLRRAVGKGHREAEFQLSICCLTGKGMKPDVTKGMELLKSAAAKEEDRAIVELAIRYQRGIDVPQNLAHALVLFRKAAKLENPDAHYHLGIWHLMGVGEGREWSKGLEWMRKAADMGHKEATRVLPGLVQLEAVAAKYAELVDQGDVEALVDLGICYVAGSGVVRDYNQAVLLFERAVEKGNSSGQVELAQLCGKGLGVEKNLKRAIKLCGLAVEQGNAYAKLLLGSFLVEQSGDQATWKKSVALWESAELQSNSQAQRLLAMCYFGGIGVDKDLSKALHYWELLAEAGDEEAQVNAGGCHYTGLATSVDYDKALKFYKQAAESGNDGGLFRLGYCSFIGHGIKRDILAAGQVWRTLKEPKKLRKEFEDSSSHYATVLLAICYEFGIGGGKDINQAFQLYQSAAEEGNPDGQFHFARLLEKGIEGKRDKQEAIKQYRLAAKQGHKAAERVLRDKD